jgi:hypothetical protein
MRVILILIILASFPILAHANIPITQSIPMVNTEFDGKWSFEYEWKPTSKTELETDEGTIFIRTAHNGNFLYVLLDVIPDKTFSKGMDKSIICFENRNEEVKSEKNYCFSAILNISTGKTFESGAISFYNSNYKLIKSPEGFIGIGGISDENDRYSKIPHATYEYRIPIDSIGRSNVYGFYVYVLDHDSENVYTWPKNVLEENKRIPSSEKWGIMFSPDKTLPEFHLGIVFLIAFIPILIIGYFTKSSNLSVKLK